MMGLMDTEPEENEAVYTFDVPGGRLKWNHALNETYGYPATEPAGTLEWWAEHIHPDDAMVLNETLDKVFNHSVGNWEVEYRFRNASGSYVRVRDHATVIRNEDGEPLRIIGALTPVAS